MLAYIGVPTYHAITCICLEQIGEVSNEIEEGVKFFYAKFYILEGCYSWRVKSSLDLVFYCMFIWTLYCSMLVYLLYSYRDEMTAVFSDTYYHLRVRKYYLEGGCKTFLTWRIFIPMFRLYFFCVRKYS